MSSIRTFYFGRFYFFRPTGGRDRPLSADML